MACVDMRARRGRARRGRDTQRRRRTRGVNAKARSFWLRRKRYSCRGQQRRAESANGGREQAAVIIGPLCRLVLPHPPTHCMYSLSGCCGAETRAHKIIFQATIIVKYGTLLSYCTSLLIYCCQTWQIKALSRCQLHQATFP